MAEENAQAGSPWVADITARALRADDQARELAARVADTALAVASTLDEVAATREARAAQVAQEPAAGQLRESARRARAMAADERDESRELRATWRRPD